MTARQIGEVDRAQALSGDHQVLDSPQPMTAMTEKKSSG